MATPARVAKGTIADKTGATTLTISLSLARRLLVAGISWNDNASGEPSVKWGNKTLARVTAIATANGISTAQYAFRRRRPSATKNLVATWSGATIPTAKAMWATSWSNVATRDLLSSATQAATGAPNAGAAQTSNFAVEAFTAAMGQEGPLNNDTRGTASGGWTLGQEAGTNGSPPASNIVCAELYKVTTATESAQAALTGATSRDWASVMSTWREESLERFNIIGYDWDSLEDYAETNNVDPGDLLMRYNPLLGRNEMYEVDVAANGTLRQVWVDDDATDWTAP